MIRTIIYICMNANYRESTQNTGFHCFFDTFANCRNVFLRNSTTNNCGFELEEFFSVGIHWLEFNFTVTILTTTTGLFCVFAVNINRFCEGFFVSNLRCTNVSFYFEFTKQTVNDDFQMKFTHTCNDCLTSFLICVCTECRVFFSQFCQCFTKFTLTSFCLRLNSQLDNWFREFHGFQNNRMLFVTDCITCCCCFETNSCCNITRVNFVKFLSLIRMHLQDTSNTFFFAFCSIQYIRTGVHSTGIYTEECQLTNKWVSHDLECQSREWFFIRRMSFYFISFHIHTFDSRDICRSRHIFKNCIQ